MNSKVNYIKHIFFLSCIIVNLLSFSQSVSITASSTNLGCGGGPLQLTANGSTASTLFGDDFNSGVLTAGWTTSPAAQFNNPCGTSLDGTTYLWMGSATSAPRDLETPEIDVSCGGKVCFDFKFMCEYCGDKSPCEGADFYNEGVSLQYSLNGTKWIDIGYFAPNGNLLTNYPGKGTSRPIAFGTTNFTTWANYCFTVPVAAQTTTTKFRLYQWGASGSNYDHWGIDNFYITSDPCTPFYYDWEHLPGTPDAASITTNINTTTTFIAHYTDGTTTYSDTITIVVNNSEVDTIIVTPETCIGDNDASISTTMLTGTPPFTFNLSGPAPPNNTGIYNNLSPGMYVMIVKDAKNCPTKYSITIPDGPSCCAVSGSSIVNPSCNGYSDGSILTSASKGISPYSYQWYDLANNPIIGEVSASINNLISNTYIVEIIDASGCVNRDTIQLNNPSSLNGNLISTPINCNDDCDAIIEFANSTGGVPNYTYSLNGGAYQSGNIFNSLCQGNYTVTLKDDNNCLFPLTSNIIEPDKIILIDTLIKNEICTRTNGEIYLTAIGGTPGYTFEFDGATNSTGIFVNLTSGTYKAKVTDSHGCSDSAQLIIPESVGPNPVIDYQQDVLCAGGINGVVTIVVSITTGTPPFLFDLNGTGTAPANTFNVNAGNHTVDVYDANNCTGAVTFSISQPTVLSYTTTHTDVICSYSCDGTITVNASGATPPYQYSSDGGLSFQSSNVLTGLCQGGINVVVRDTNGCLANSLVNISGPIAINSSNTIVDPTCFDGCDGSISFGLTSGGTAPYEYSINNGITYQSSPFFTNLCALTDDIIVKDDKDCELIMSGIMVNNPLQITFNDISNIGSNCGFFNGSFEVQAQNGTSPYSYTIDNGLNNQSTGNFGALNSGIYNVIVTDDNGCKDSTEESISDLEITTSLDSIQHVTCFGGTDGGAFLSIVNGLPPITFTLDSVYFQNTGDFDGAINPNVKIPAGKHFAMIHDSGNCSDYYEFNITQPDSITYIPQTTNTLCIGSSDGIITFNNTAGGAGGPYTYSINAGVSFFNSNIFNGLAKGTYQTLVRDGNGCSSGMPIEISEPDSIFIKLNPSNLVCNGDNSGSLIVVAQGGAQPYIYDIGPTNNLSGIFISLSAAQYLVQVIDANGCIEDTIQTILEPDTITANITIIDNLCFEDCGGQIIIDAQGGTLPFLFSANAGVNQQSSDTIINVCAGIHSVQIEDFNKCKFSINQIVNQPNELQLSLTYNRATCGLNNGEIIAIENGGTAPFEFSLSADNGLTYSIPNSSNIFNNLPPGYYLLKVIDDNGCESIESIIVTTDDVPTIDFIQITNILCNGDDDGVIQVTSGLGIGQHEYSLDNLNYSTNNTFSNLPAGNYLVSVRDSNLCIEQASTSIIEPNTIINTPASTDLLCNSDFSGTINITANGGTPNYLFSIDDGISFHSFGLFKGLSAGNYSTIVKDANNCSDTIQLTLLEPTSLSANPQLVDVSCFGACDGTIDLQPGGGTGNYIFNWTGNIAGTNDDIAANICAGNYDVRITDANGCTDILTSIPISEPPLLSITNVIAHDDSCFNACLGSIEINSPTAVQFEIILNGNSTINANNIFTGLCIGNYDIKVRDIAGCEATSNTSIIEPDLLVGSAPTDWTNVCFGTDVNITPGITTGGTSSYTYNWSDSDGNLYPNQNTFVYTANNLLPVTFTFDIVDANGCTDGPYSYIVSTSDPLIVVASADVSICPGESVTISAIGSGGQMDDIGQILDYHYSWDTGNPIDTIPNVEVTPATTTTYTISLTDFCDEVATDEVIVTIYDDPIPVLTGNTAQCPPFVTDIWNNNGTSYSNCEWTFSNGATINDCNYPINTTFNTPGIYDLSVNLTSIDGCTYSNNYPGFIEIYDDPTAEFSYTPNKPIISNSNIEFINRSTVATFFEWNFNEEQSSNEINPIFDIDYIEETIIKVCLEAITDDNCMDAICKHIVIGEDLLFYVPNAFTPDGQGLNSEFSPIFTTGFDPYQYEFTIFDRWGEILFVSYYHKFGWDGLYQNLPVSQGVYVWKISFKDTFENENKVEYGHVTLLK